MHKIFKMAALALKPLLSSTAGFELHMLGSHSNSLDFNIFFRRFTHRTKHEAG